MAMISINYKISLESHCFKTLDSLWTGVRDDRTQYFAVNIVIGTPYDPEKIEFPFSFSN